MPLPFPFSPPRSPFFLEFLGFEEWSVKPVQSPRARRIAQIISQCDMCTAGYGQRQPRPRASDGNQFVFVSDFSFLVPGQKSWTGGPNNKASTHYELYSKTNNCLSVLSPTSWIPFVSRKYSYWGPPFLPAEIFIIILLFQQFCKYRCIVVSHRRNASLPDLPRIPGIRSKTLSLRSICMHFWSFVFPPQVKTETCWSHFGFCSAARDTRTARPSHSKKFQEISWARSASRTAPRWSSFQKARGSWAESGPRGQRTWLPVRHWV